jgi:hypothetical protein
LIDVGIDQVEGYELAGVDGLFRDDPLRLERRRGDHAGRLFLGGRQRRRAQEPFEGVFLEGPRLLYRLGARRFHGLGGRRDGIRAGDLDRLDRSRLFGLGRNRRGLRNLRNGLDRDLVLRQDLLDLDLTIGDHGGRGGLGRLGGLHPLLDGRGGLGLRLDRIGGRGRAPGDDLLDGGRRDRDGLADHRLRGRNAGERHHHARAFQVDLVRNRLLEVEDHAGHEIRLPPVLTGADPRHPGLAHLVVMGLQAARDAVEIDDQPRRIVEDEAVVVPELACHQGHDGIPASVGSHHHVGQVATRGLDGRRRGGNVAFIQVLCCDLNRACDQHQHGQRGQDRLPVLTHWPYPPPGPAS